MSAKSNTSQTRGAVGPDEDAPALPIIQPGQALMSLRDSGYNLPTALAEVVDNSIEAGARRITLRLDEREDAGRKSVHRISISDDGEGMDRRVLHHYLVLGHSSRYMRTDTIGKYGVGAKLAALTFATKIDVWSRRADDAPWLHVGFDLDAAIANEVAGVPGATDIVPPRAEPIPADLVALLPSGKGTLVSWSNVDRLEQGRYAPTFKALETEVIKETGRIFREFLNGGIRIEVNGTVLLPHDPLFLMEGTIGDAILSKVSGAAGKRDRTPSHFAAQTILRRQPIPVNAADGAMAYLTVTLHPEAITRDRGLGGDGLSKELRIPDNEGAISFMRMKREIAYTNVPRIFPSGVKDIDRFIGIEVAFDPELDRMFGVRNVKRGVEPHGELRDKIKAELRKSIPTARALLTDRWAARNRTAKVNAGEHGPMMKAVADADKAMPRGRATPVPEEDARRELEDLARDTGHGSTPEEAAEYAERVRTLPFIIESVDFPGKQFIDIRHLDGRIVIRLNTRHRFYREAWKPLQELAANADGQASGAASDTAARAVEAITLLIVAFAKAQSMDEDPSRYDDLTAFWGQFVDTLMGKVKDVMR